MYFTAKLVRVSIKKLLITVMKKNAAIQLLYFLNTFRTSYTALDLNLGEAG